MGMIIEGAIPDSAKAAVERKLQALFVEVFKQGPPLGRFNFRSQARWKDYYKELKMEILLRGILICRAPNSETPWFPIYHFIDDLHDHSEIKIPKGSNKYSYIATRG